MILLCLLKLLDQCELLLILGDPLLQRVDLVLHRLDYLGGEFHQLHIDLRVRILQKVRGRGWGTLRRLFLEF